MDKYIKVLCDQNPITELTCDNNSCKHIITVKSVEFFKNDIYKYTCPKCGYENEINNKKFKSDFISQMKKSKITPV